MAGLRSVKLGLSLAAEFLATLVAYETLSYFTRLQGWWLLGFSALLLRLLRCRDVVEGFILVCFKPLESSLYYLATKRIGSSS